MSIKYDNKEDKERILISGSKYHENTVFVKAVGDNTENCLPLASRAFHPIICESDKTIFPFIENSSF